MWYTHNKRSLPTQAAECYLKVAELSEKLKQEHDAATAYVNAAKCYKGISSADAVRMFKMAVEMHMENNRFATAAKMYKEIAELEEKEMNLEAALVAYQDSADCYFNEDSTTSGNQMLLKVAEMAASSADYSRAIQIYEKVANSSLDNNLLKWSVKDYYFKASLCNLAMGAKTGDMAKTTESLEKYMDLHPAFEDSRECKLIQSCLEAVNDGDVEAFTGHVFKYDSVYKLDNWTASILLVVKDAVGDGPELDLA